VSCSRAIGWTTAVEEGAAAISFTNSTITVAVGVTTVTVPTANHTIVENLETLPLTVDSIKTPTCNRD
jgi:hypothetical protein